jgi:hypothetical protein
MGAGNLIVTPLTSRIALRTPFSGMYLASIGLLLSSIQVSVALCLFDPFRGARRNLQLCWISCDSALCTFSIVLCVES